MSKTILVVDDTENLRTLVKSYLTQEGFRVLTAANGRDALFLARDEKPDLILLDLMMPEMGGYEFMRVYGREAETPTIILTINGTRFNPAREFDVPETPSTEGGGNEPAPAPPRSAPTRAASRGLDSPR